MATDRVETIGILMVRDSEEFRRDVRIAGRELEESALSPDHPAFVTPAGIQFRMDATAYHESGHALMAVYVGAEVQSVTIDPDWDDGPERFGDTQIVWEPGRYSPQEFLEKRILVALAGPVAEMLYTGDAFHPALVAEWAADWREAWTVAEELLPDRQKRLSFLEQTARELHRMLNGEDCWSALAALADYLLAHETLEADQIDEIVGVWIRR